MSELGEADLLGRLELAGFSLDEACYLSERGISSGFAADWRERFPYDSPEELAGFFAWNPDLAPEWREANFSVSQAADWHSAGIAPASAQELNDQGIPAPVFLEWQERFPREELTSFRAQVRELNPALAVFPECLELRVALGGDRENLSAWLGAGFTIEEIGYLLEAGLDGRRAAFWRSRIPDCPADAMRMVFEANDRIIQHAIAWMVAFPDDSPEDIAFVSACMGQLDRLEGLWAAQSGSSERLTIAQLKAFLGQASAFLDRPEGQDRFSSTMHSDDLLVWSAALPDRSLAWISDFIECSGMPGWAALRWHLAFPDDPPELIARYAIYDLRVEWALALRREFPDDDPEEMFAFLMLLSGAYRNGSGSPTDFDWEFCLSFRREFPDWSADYIMELSESLGVRGPGDVLSWCRRNPEISSAEIIALTGEVFEVPLPESDDIIFVTRWIDSYTHDSPDLIRQFLDAFDGARDSALTWRRMDPDPQQALSFCKSLSVPDVDRALAYKQLGVEPEVAGCWDSVFYATEFDSASGLREWLEVFPEMTVDQVYQAAQWFEQGFDSPSEVAGWVGQEVDLFNALLFVACGCSDPELARTWLDRGFSGPDAARLLSDRWVTPAEIEAASGVELSLDNRELLAGFRAYGFSPEEAGGWISCGVVVASAASEWQQAGFDPVSSALWLSVNCPAPSLARLWRDQDVSPARAAGILEEQGVGWLDADPASCLSSTAWRPPSIHPPDGRLS